MKCFARVIVTVVTLVLSVHLANAGNIQPNFATLPSVRALTSVVQESPFNGNCPPPLTCAAASDFSANVHLFGSATKSMPTILQEGPINTNCPPPLVCAIPNSTDDNHMILKSRIRNDSTLHRSAIALLTFQSALADTQKDSGTGYYPMPQIYAPTTSASHRETDKP